MDCKDHKIKSDYLLLLAPDVPFFHHSIIPLFHYSMGYQMPKTSLFSEVELCGGGASGPGFLTKRSENKRQITGRILKDVSLTAIRG